MRIVILTGAGISSESGIQTFRASDGLWENHRIEDVATMEGFIRDPELVHKFYNMRRAQLKSVQPNAAHYALAKLQKHYPNDVTIITQNVDDLHERAGANVIHMHGELRKIRCLSCGSSYQWTYDCWTTSNCLICQQVGVLRSDIVWFGEIPYGMTKIDTALTQCQLFASIGTSGQVYPAASFVEIAHKYGAKTLEINLEKTTLSDNFDENIYGLATKEVTSWVEAMIA